MRIHQVLTTPIVTEDKDLMIERMDQERHLAASTLGCAELHLAAILTQIAPLADLRKNIPELDAALLEIEGACHDALNALEFDEIEFDGAMDPDATKAFLESAREMSECAKQALARAANRP